MSRTKTHLIDDTAKRFFENSLPTRWVHREQHPDYCVDYRIEVYDDEERSGLAFQVQLKGTEHLRMLNGQALFSFETKHIAEYADRILEPVFLVVVDVAKHVGYWVFAQGCIDNALSAVKWRDRRTATVHLPATNMLTDSALLRSAVDAASKYMLERHPAAVDAALKADIAKWQAIDPRFRIELRTEGCQRHYTIHPRTDVQGTIQFTGPSKLQRENIEKLIERGLTVESHSGEIEVKGSPLFEAIGKIVSIKAAREASGTATIRRIDAKGCERASLPSLPCTFSGGTKEYRIQVQLPHQLGQLEQTGQAGESNVRSTFAINLHRWDGLPILSLPSFEQIAAVLCCEASDSIVVEYFRPGERLASGTFQNADRFRGISDFLEFARTLRSIGRHFQLNPPLPVDFTPLQLRDITILSALVESRQYAGDGSVITFTVTMSPEETMRLLATTDNLEAVPVSFKGSMTFDFLGTPLTLEGLKTELTHVRLKSNKNDLLRRLKKKTDARLEVQYVGTELSQLTHRLPEPR